jgi:hypothetical protein
MAGMGGRNAPKTKTAAPSNRIFILNAKPSRLTRGLYFGAARRIVSRKRQTPKTP